MKSSHCASFGPPASALPHSPHSSTLRLTIRRHNSVSPCPVSSAVSPEHRIASPRLDSKFLDSTRRSTGGARGAPEIQSSGHSIETQQYKYSRAPPACPQGRFSLNCFSALLSTPHSFSACERSCAPSRLPSLLASPLPSYSPQFSCPSHFAAREDTECAGVSISNELRPEGRDHMHKSVTISIITEWMERMYRFALFCFLY